MSEEYAGLFRQEVLEARRVRLEGEILLSRPLRATPVAALLVTSLVAATVWVASGRYARVESAKGIIATDAAIAKVIAIRPGVITDLPIREGQAVRKGQLLAHVQVDQPYAEGGRSTDEELAAVGVQEGLANEQLRALASRADTERSGLRASIEGAERQYSDIAGQLDLQRQIVASLEGALERYGPVAEAGFISRTELERRRQELLNAKAGVSRLQQQLTTVRADEARARAELARSFSDEIAQVAGARSTAQGLRLQRSQLRGQQTYVLTAPMDGIVTALQAGAGKTVDANVPLLTIMPRNATVHAELYAPSRAIGFVKAGEEVRLLYDAFPYQRFGSFRGRITNVSRTSLDPRHIDALIKMDEPVYRVDVDLFEQTVGGYGERARLLPGMTLSANIVLERLSFLEWLLEPLHAVLKRDQ